MKASKILAGLSAASIAASMLSMVSFADAEHTGKVTIAGNSSWWGAVEVPAETLLAGADKDSAKEIVFKADNNFMIGWNSSEVTGKNEDNTDNYWKTTENATEYTMPISDINWDEAIYNFQIVANTNDETPFDVTWEVVSETASEEDASSEESSELPAPVALPEVETSLEVNVNPGEHEYGGDWGSDVSKVPLTVFQEASKNNAPVFLTINATRLPGYDYALAAPADEHGWGKIYNEGAEAGSKFEWKANSISGLRLKSALTNDQLETVTDPVLQNDGFIVFPSEAKDYEFTIALSPDAVNSFIANAEDEPADDGSLWGGMIFQVYGVKINSMVAKTVGTAPEANPASTDSGEVNGYMMFAASDWSQSIFPFDDDGNPTENAVYAAINEDGQYSLTYNNAFDVFKTDAASSVPGALIFNIDFPGVYSGPNGTKDENGNKYGDDNQRQLLYPDFDVTIDSIVVDGVEVAFDASKIKKGNVENQTNNYRVELYNEYGDTKADPAFDPALINGDTVTVNFTVKGLEKKDPTVDPEPTPTPDGALLSKDGVVVTKGTDTAFAVSLDGKDLPKAEALDKYQVGTREYFDYFDNIEEDSYAVMSADEYDQLKATKFGFATLDTDTKEYNMTKCAKELGTFEYAGFTFTAYQVTDENGVDMICLVYPNLYQTGRYSAIVPALWPLINKEDLDYDTLNYATQGGQLDFADPYNWTDTCSEDLYDYIKAIHDADPKANVTFTFKAIGTPEGTPVAAFLKTWTVHKANKKDKEYKDVDPAAYELGQIVWCAYGTNDWKKWDEVGTKPSPTGEYENVNIEFDIQYTKVTKEADYSENDVIYKNVHYTTDENKKTSKSVKGDGTTYYLMPDGSLAKSDNGLENIKSATAEKKPIEAWIVQTSRNTKYSKGKKWNTSELNYDATGFEGGPCYKAGETIVLVPKKDWHDYFFTNEGLVDTQATRGMAAGVTNNTRFSQMTENQINYIKKAALENGAPGIFYNDVDGDHYVNKNVINGVDSCQYPYGHFIIFGDGETENEYSFTMSAAAIDQILEQSLRSEGAVLPFSIDTWKRPQAAMHGPIWLQAHEEAVPVLAKDGKRNIDVKVWSSTEVRTPNEIPYLYGKSDYKGMYTPVDENGNPIEAKKEETTTTTTTTTASTPAASSTTSDANADTGAAAGFGIAGLLLAGAAMVCAKKKH